MDFVQILHQLNPWALEFPKEASFGPFLLTTLLGFAAVVAFAWYLVPGPMIREILSERRQSIKHAADQVDSTLRETEEMRNDFRTRLERIEEETHRRLDEAVREAETLRQTILGEAKQAAEAIVRRGEDEVSRERAKAMVSLRSEFVEDVIRAAEYAASRSLDSAQQGRLVSEFVQGVERARAAS